MRAGKLSANLIVRFAKSFACVQIFDKLNISPRVNTIEIVVPRPPTPNMQAFPYKLWIISNLTSLHNYGLSTVAHRCHGNILKHQRNHFNIKRQHAATYALGLHGHFKNSRQQLRISRQHLNKNLMATFK